ncbi:MAG: LPS-assembly protein LptD [Acetobacteraceae bacterium]
MADRHAPGLGVALLLVLLATLLPLRPAAAQPSVFSTAPGQQFSNTEPVTFLADKLTYDRNTGVVTATGHVQAWQTGHVLQADKVTYNRNTGITIATGNVVLLEPDGQVLFADRAQLSKGMQNAVLTGISVRLAQNARLIANGGRRTGGKINELAHAVYSTCNLCAKNPTAPPLWQITASRIVQDLVNKRIEYYDAMMRIYGVPVFYFPYFWTVDPSVKRGTGLLAPSFGTASHIGEFLTVPYYFVLDGQSDIVVAPTIATRAGPQLNLDYRRHFNNGQVSLNGYIARDEGSAQGALFANGNFSYNNTYRYGFSYNRATSANYLRDFNIANGADILTSQGFVEGFGQGAYTRLDATIYQGLNSSIDDAALPVVLPHWQYSFFGAPDALGGRFSLDTGYFNVLRPEGANVQRVDAIANWDRPAVGPAGTLWDFAVHLTSAAYVANRLELQPDFFSFNSESTARALPEAGVTLRWPFMRSGAWGTQLLEPIAQFIAAPNVGDSYSTIPNEDSLYLEFTDANLFGWNKFPGIDQAEGGIRANYALHGAWYIGGATIDGLIGQSWRLDKDSTDFPVGSGLENNLSDVVTRLSVTPNPWLDFTWQSRFASNPLRVRFTNATASFGTDRFRLSAGYLFTPTNPYELDTAPTIEELPEVDMPRNEISLGASSHIGAWHLSGYGRENLADGKADSAGFTGSWENECMVVALQFARRFTSLNGDNGATMLLLQITFKTVGQVGFNAL